MCCTRLAGNTGGKNDAKNRHLGTIAQLCWAVSSQLRHVSTIGKKLVKHTSSTCPRNMVNFRPLTAEIGLGVWGTPANFNGFRIFAALHHGTLVLGVSHQPNFAALNRGRHLYSARRPSRWALANILVLHASSTSETRAKMFSKTSTACRPQKLTLTFKLVRVRDHTRLPCESGANPFSGSQDISYTNKKLEQRCFFQTWTTCRPPKSPQPQGNGPVCCCLTLFAASALQCIMQQNGWWEYTARFWSLVTLIFDLDIQARPSEEPNTSSLWIVRKSIQPITRYLIHKQTQTAPNTEPYAVHCVW